MHNYVLEWIVSNLSSMCPSYLHFSTSPFRSIDEILDQIALSAKHKINLSVRKLIVL